MDIQVVPITGEFITLAQFLKKVNLISSGGETKFFLETNEVMVNGESEKRRGRKIHHGDQVIIQGQTYDVV